MGAFGAKRFPLRPSTMPLALAQAIALVYHLPFSTSVKLFVPEASAPSSRWSTVTSMARVIGS